MAYYSPNDQLPIRRKKPSMRKAFSYNEEQDLPDVGASLASTRNTRVVDANKALGPKQPAFNSKGLVNAAESLTPYVSNIVNAIRKTPKPTPPRMVSAVSISSPSLAGERVEIDRSVRGVNLGADQSLDANTAASVKVGNLIQGLRVKGQSFTNEANMKVQATNSANQINGGIDAFNAQRGDQYDNNKLGMQIATARESSENIANFADKRIQEMARRDAMGLDKTKFNILSKMYGSGVLDRLVKKVNGSDQVTDEDLGNILHGSKANGGALLPNLFPSKVKMRKVVNTPPEMADQYKAEGGELGAPVAKTQAQVVAANMEAQRFMKARGYNKAPYYAARKVGDTLPQYVGADNKPFVQAPQKPLPMTVPSYAQASDIQSSNGQFFYTDNQTGYLTQVDPSVVNLPRFRKPAMRNGGYIGGHIMHTPRINSKGKLRRVY